MLVGAAADRWNVDAGGMRHRRRVRHQRGAHLHVRRACRGSRRPQPAAARRRCATSAKRRLIGQPLPRLDGPGKGRRQPALRRRRAAARTCCSRRSALAPPGGRLSGFSREAVKACTRRSARRRARRWVAVVADSWWAAERALKAADPQFLGQRRRRPTCGRCSKHALADGRRATTGSAAAIMNRRCADRARSPRPIMSRRRSISASSR